MIMEIYLNKEKAEQEGYDVRTLYGVIDDYFLAQGVPKIGNGMYGGESDQKTFTAFGRITWTLPETSWFLKVVDEWYVRENGNEIKNRIDYLERYRNLGVV